MKKFFGEFKEFIMRGNVMDMAVGVVVGGAFQAIVKSLVDDIIMPLISLITGGVDFSSWYITLAEIPEGVENNYTALKEAGVAMFSYGNFISSIIYFIILAFMVFLMIKAINSVHKLAPKKKKEEEKPAEPTTKKCPYCQSEIDIKATRCPHCTSELAE